MRILLLNPSVRPEQFGRFSGLLEAMPCGGLAYVATFLSKAGHEVRVFDDFAIRRGEAAFEEEVRQFAPDVVGVSVLTPVATHVTALVKRLREAHPGLRFLFGNIHADLFPEEFLGDGDAAVHREGEHTAVEIVAAWAAGRSAAGIAGTTVRVGDDLVRGPVRELRNDLDDWPFPDWNLLPYHQYSLLPLGTIARPIVSVIAGRGCPFKCSYCALENQGKTYRRRSAANVVDEIQRNVEVYGVRQVGFMDPIFPLGDRHAIDFSREMVRRGLHDQVIWLSELRTDLLSREALAWMKKAGCRRLVFGIESGDDELLRSVNKNNSASRSRQTVQWCRELGITTVGLFMIGLPGETPAQTRATIDYACSLELDFAKFAITVPFPGSELYAQMVADGRLNRRDWDAFTTMNPDIATICVASEVQSPEQLLAALREATLRFYMRPRMIARQLFKIRSVDARQMAAGLWSIAPDLPLRPLRSRLRGVLTGPRLGG